ncbi:MAG: hypothetical protein K2R98_16820 [Gemmataceae bacterium]|nr:hypothetical protein [Gemmataceae bacterium]
MSSLSAPPARVQQGAARKTRKPARFIRWLELPDPSCQGWGACEIAVGPNVTAYLFRQVPCHLGGALIGYELEKLTPALTETGESYHVVIDVGPHRQHSCECLGFLRHGHCKHVDGIMALRVAPRASKHRSTTDAARNDPEAYWQEMQRTGI